MQVEQFYAHGGLDFFPCADGEAAIETVERVDHAPPDTRGPRLAVCFSTRSLLQDAGLCIAWHKARDPAVVGRLLHAKCPVVIAKDGDGEPRRLGSRAIEAHQLKRGAPCHKRPASSKRRLS